MTMPEVSYSQLLNQYHTAISKAQNYQEELAKKKEQWEKREREFNITEKLTRELCEDILAKDGEEMKLGEEYSWSSIPINKLIKKTGDVFRQYNSDRTELEKKLMKTAEERRQQIESLQDQIIRMKTKDSNGDFSIENKSASLKNKEEYDPKKIQSVISTDVYINSIYFWKGYNKFQQGVYLNTSLGKMYYSTFQKAWFSSNINLERVDIDAIEREVLIRMGIDSNKELGKMTARKFENIKKGKQFV